MKTLILIPALCGFLALAACSDAPVSSDSPEVAKAKAEQVQAEVSKVLDLKNVGDLIDYSAKETKGMISILESVTDGPTAEAAVTKVRDAIPHLNAAAKAFQTQDMSDMKVSMAMLKKMPDLLKTQGQLMTEVKRIAEIPEARAVLETEFDKLDIFK